MEDVRQYKICIGIPTLNGPPRLKRCLQSILKYTPLKEYEALVLVSDDFSGEENLLQNKAICAEHGVELLTTEKRLGVAQQWNRLTHHTTSPIMILMNDDVEVVYDWLEALVFSIKNNPHAGMVGLKAYQGVNSEHFTLPPVPSYNEAIMEQGHSLISSHGFLFGFERSKFDAIGGFDPQFLAFYEELDFGVRLLLNNWPPYILSYPIVLHEVGATTTDPRNLDAQNTLIESRAKFKAKHVSVQNIRNLIQGRTYPKCIHWNTSLKTLTD